MQEQKICSYVFMHVYAKNDLNPDPSKHSQFENSTVGMFHCGSKIGIGTRLF